MSASLLARVQAAFTERYGAAPTVVVRAPGRVNLIGEHTDYNDGFVLPCAIDRHTLVAARPREDGQVRVLALDARAPHDRFDLAEPIVRIERSESVEPAGTGAGADRAWADYVRGMVAALQDDGWPLRGADLAISGDVPQGAGLSSSAALEVAVGQAFATLQGLDLPAQRLAQLAQRAENHFVGCACGIMDQLISARGKAGHALLIDCRSLAVRPVPLPAGSAVLIVDSRVQRGLVGSEYNTRRRQCEAAAAHYGVAALRDLDEARLLRDRGTLDAVSFRRARHIVTENRRTLAAADALAAGDLQQLGPLMAQSHASMRDDFEITVPPIDRLVELLQAVITEHGEGHGGARMTGGGFGGCVVAVLPQALVPVAEAAIATHYRAPHGEAATVYVSQPSDGAGPVAGAYTSPSAPLAMPTVAP